MAAQYDPQDKWGSLRLIDIALERAYASGELAPLIELDAELERSIAGEHARIHAMLADDTSTLAEVDEAADTLARLYRVRKRLGWSIRVFDPRNTIIHLKLDGAPLCGQAAGDGGRLWRGMSERPGAVNCKKCLRAMDRLGIAPAS